MKRAIFFGIVFLLLFLSPASAASRAGKEAEKVYLKPMQNYVKKTSPGVTVTLDSSFEKHDRMNTSVHFRYTFKNAFAPENAAFLRRYEKKAREIQKTVLVKKLSFKGYVRMPLEVPKGKTCIRRGIVTDIDAYENACLKKQEKAKACEEKAKAYSEAHKNDPSLFKQTLEETKKSQNDPNIPDVTKYAAEQKARHKDETENDVRNLYFMEEILGDGY